MQKKEELVLPIINLSYPDLDYSQLALLKKLDIYQAQKREKNPEQQADFAIENDIGLKVVYAPMRDGLCVGLTAYWLYCKRVGEEGKFIDKLEYALTWDDDAFAKKWAKEDPKLEVLINVIAFLSFDKILRPDIHQYDLNKSLQLILSEFYPQVSKPEFELIFSFSKPILEYFIQDYIHPNKMVRIGSLSHYIGLIYSGGVYYCYDPSCVEGPKAYNSPQELCDKIFDSFPENANHPEHLALCLSIFDLEDEAPGIYFEGSEFCQVLMGDEEYSRLTLNNPDLFRLACMHGDFYLLNLMFDSGFKYLPCTGDKPTEYNFAINYNQVELFEYLLAHNIPLNHRPTAGLTPLGVAILDQRTKMLFMLLAAGADPNIMAKKEASTLEMAVSHDNIEAIILLLAFGFEYSQESLEALFDRYKHDKKQIPSIIEHAVSLRAKLNIKTLAKNNNDTLSDISSPQEPQDFIQKASANYKSRNILFTPNQQANTSLSYDSDVLPLLRL